jgi:hypothetical protein
MNQLIGFLVDLSKSLKSLYEIIPFRSELFLIDIFDDYMRMLEALSCTAFLNVG